MARAWKQRVFNYMRQVYVDPCDPNRNIYAEMALDGLYIALLSYAEPGWKDTVDLLTGKSWIKHGSARLKAAKPASPVWFGATGDLLVTVAEGLDKLAWLVMVLTSAFDAFIRWGSAAYQVSPCEAAPTYIWWRSKHPQQFASIFDEFTLGPAWFVDAGNVGDLVSSRINIPPGYNGYVCFAVKVEQFLGLGHIESYSTRVVDLSGKVLYEKTYVPVPGPDNKGPMIFIPIHRRASERVLEFQISVKASSHVAEWYVPQGYCAGALRSVDTPFATSPYLKSGFHRDVTSVLDPF